MLSHKRLSEVKVNDFIVFNSGKARRVVKISHQSGYRMIIKPRCFIYFDKVKGKGTTIMMYADINHKAIGIWKQKK